MPARKTKPPASSKPPADRLPLDLPGLAPGASACCERQHTSLTARLAHGYTPAQLAHAYTPAHNRPCPYCNDPHPLTLEKDGSC